MTSEKLLSVPACLHSLRLFQKNLDGMQDSELADMLSSAEASMLQRRAAPNIGTTHEVDLTRRLLLACEQGHPHLVRLLIQAGACVIQRDGRGRSPLMTAGRYGHTAVIELLLQTPSPNEDKFCRSAALQIDEALYTAAGSGHVETARCLLEHCSDVDRDLGGVPGAPKQYVSNPTALCVATRSGHVDVARLLLAHGANPSWQSTVELSSSPLAGACRSGSEEMVVLLLDAKADVLKLLPSVEKGLEEAEAGLEIARQLDELRVGRLRGAKAQTMADYIPPAQMLSQSAALRKSLGIEGNVRMRRCVLAVRAVAAELNAALLMAEEEEASAAAAARPRQPGSGKKKGKAKAGHGARQAATSASAVGGRGDGGSCAATAVAVPTADACVAPPASAPAPAVPAARSADDAAASSSSSSGGGGADLGEIARQLDELRVEIQGLQALASQPWPHDGEAARAAEVERQLQAARRRRDRLKERARKLRVREAAPPTAAAASPTVAEEAARVAAQETARVAAAEEAAAAEAEAAAAEAEAAAAAAEAAAAEAAAAAAAAEDDDVPDEYICPITAEVMSDPVCLSDGFTYERAAIAQWLETHNTSPKTGAPLELKALFPNTSLRITIRKFVEESGRA